MSAIAAVEPTEDPYCPHPARICAVMSEVPAVATFALEFEDQGYRDGFRYQPGQFNMVYLPGVGEVAISISSAPYEGPNLRHTIRFVGRVTNALKALRPGATIGLRGPYGRPWPLEATRTRDIVLIAGGLGMAPLRPAVMSLLSARGNYGRLTLLYGARQPGDLLYTSEYDDWQQRGLNLHITVDRADARWRGVVGVVPALLAKLDLDPANTVIMTCGPDVMMRYTVQEALTRGVAESSVYVSLERNMHCAVGLCGRCQLGPEFLCKDGPVFSYGRVARFLTKEHF